MVYVLYMTSPESFEAAGFVQVFQRAAPAAYLDRLSLEHGLTVRRGIYSLAAVIWLMIFQRLNSKRTLSSAVQWLVLNAARLPPGANLCKRVLEQGISAGTGGYCPARETLATFGVARGTDHLCEQLQAQMREELPDVPRPMFVIDGTPLRLPHERELVSAFPPGHNQHGDNHWPTMLLVAFHDVHSGLATRPSWGAMYGPGGGRRTGTGPPGSGAAADGGHRAGGRQLRHFRVCLRRAPNPAPAAVAADRRARPEGAGRRQAALRQTPEGSLGSQRLGAQNAPGPARRSAGGGLGGSLPAPRAPRGDLVFLHHPGPEAQAHPGALQTALEHRNRSAKFEAHGGSASAHQ